MLRFVFAAILTCLIASDVDAQLPPGKVDVSLGYSRDVSKSPNLDIAYAFDEREAGNGKQKGFNGFSLSATYKFSELIAFKVLAANHFSSGTLQTGIVYESGNPGNITISGGDTKLSRASLLGGVQVSKKFRNLFIPFGHVLAGMHRQSAKIKTSDDRARREVKDLYGSSRVSSTGLSTGIGVGLDIKLKDPRFDIRALQINYLFNFVGSKLLSDPDKPYKSTSGYLYQVSIEKHVQKQLTIGVGLVYHL